MTRADVAIPFLAGRIRGHDNCARIGLHFHRHPCPFLNPMTRTPLAIVALFATLPFPPSLSLS